MASEPKVSKGSNKHVRRAAGGQLSRTKTGAAGAFVAVSKRGKISQSQANSAVDTYRNAASGKK